MPQFDQLTLTYMSQIFWVLVFLGLIYFGIGKGMLPKIEGTVEARDKKIADDLAAAERARAVADETEEAYRIRMDETRASALKATQEAKSAAAADSEVRVKAADAELSAKLAAADARLKAAQAEALKGIEDVAAEAAQEIVAKVSGRKAGKAEASRAVKAALAQG